MPFVSFFFPNYNARSSSIKLNRSREDGRLALFSVLGGKGQHLGSRYDVSVGVSYIRSRKIPSILSFLRVLSGMSVELIICF